MLTIPTDAHDAMQGWPYPVECCSNKDCFEYPAEDVKVEGDGFRLKEGEYIPRKEARESPDGHYHICRGEGNKNGSMITAGHWDTNTGGMVDPKPCFWYPPQGM